MSCIDEAKKPSLNNKGFLVQGVAGDSLLVELDDCGTVFLTAIDDREGFVTTAELPIASLREILKRVSSITGDSHD